MSAIGSTFRVSLARFALAVLALDVAPAHAAIYTVGTTGGCSHGTLQSAVNAAQATPGADTIRVNNETFTAQEVTINSADQEMNIFGGYANCGASEPSGSSRAILDGSGGNAWPVMSINVGTSGIVRLRSLVIRDGDNSASEGGGIYFQGDGLLDIRDSAISNNTAGYGGGLYARGWGAAAKVVFGPNVIVNGNVARRSGGGIYADQVNFFMTDPGSAIFGNDALGDGDGGYGGGLMALVDERPFTVHVGIGLGGSGVIFGNSAKYGGGIALVADGLKGDVSPICNLFVHSAVAGQPAGIRDNVASIQGGGLYLRSYDDFNGGQTVWLADFWNANLEANSAPTGAAIYTDGDGVASGIRFNSDTASRPAPPGFACLAGQFCGGIVDNVAQTPDGTPTDGAVIHMIRGGDPSRGTLEFGLHDGDRALRGGMVIEGNRGGRLIHAGDDQEVRLENVLIADNEVGHPLIHIGNHGFLRLTDVSLAGNAIANGNPVLQFGDGNLTLERSIIWQPGRTVLQCSGCGKTFSRVMANERDSLDGGSGSEVVVTDPRFVDPANGHYQLRAGSPAIDYALAIDSDERDVAAQPRDVDLPIKVNVFGSPLFGRDIGAFERQTLQPLVLNSDFDIDTRLWTPLDGVTVGLSTFNASGGASSGSLVMSKGGVEPGQAAIGARQCIHLPGPARYALNGWGRSKPDGISVPPYDSTQLRWTLRHAGGEVCTNGAIAASGIHSLGAGAWKHPASPAVIDVSAQDWTSDSTLIVELVVVKSLAMTTAGTARGWFDGITLETGFDDTIFRDGFD